MATIADEVYLEDAMAARKRDHLRTNNPQLSFCALPSQQPVPGKYNFPGGIAQLVERQLCKLDVRGSNPLASMRSMEASYDIRSHQWRGGDSRQSSLPAQYLGPVAQLVRACA